MLAWHLKWCQVPFGAAQSPAHLSPTVYWMCNLASFFFSTHSFFEEHTNIYPWKQPSEFWKSCSCGRATCEQRPLKNGWPGQWWWTQELMNADIQKHIGTCDWDRICGKTPFRFTQSAMPAGTFGWKEQKQWMALWDVRLIEHFPHWR